MASAGDRDRLNRLVSEHVPAALRFAVRLAGRVEPAEEIVQEALCRAARGFESFGGRCEFRTWFFRIVVNAFRDWLAANRHDRCADLPEELVDRRALDPAEAAAAGELGAMIARRISALPPRQREVLVLVVYEQMSVAEVAQMLGVSPTNVHVNLHHARSRLRAELAPYLIEK